MTGDAVNRALHALTLAGVWPHDAHVKRDLVDPSILWAEPFGLARRFTPDNAERDLLEWLADVAEARLTAEMAVSA